MNGQVIILFWATLSGLAACMTLPGSVELLLLSLGALLPLRPAYSSGNKETWSVAVVVPAHNEEANIALCIRSLFRCERLSMHVDVIVVADNCTDGTERIAKAEGATVLQRTHREDRGKGFALHFAFTDPATLRHDCVLVVDADTEVASNFIFTAAGAMRQGAAAVQACYLSRNTEGTLRTRLMAFSLRAFNRVRPLGRDNLGLSAGILGNGFGLTRETLDAVPYTASSVVEDLEYHLQLVKSGRRVVFLNRTTVFGEMPVRGKGVETQRSRWEGGRLRMLFQKSPGLLGDVLRGHLRCLEPLLELLLLPLAFHVTLLLVALTSPLPAIRMLGLGGTVVVLLHLAVTIVIGDDTWSDLVTLASAPLYIVWKLRLIPSLLRGARSEQAWVRTTRNADARPKADL